MNIFRHKQSGSGGFSFTDLLALILTLFILAFLATPIIALDSRTSSAARCMGNLRQLTFAWQLYTADNRDRLVHNVHGGDAANGYAASIWVSPWASGWLTWGMEKDNTNVLFIRNARWARLAPYVTTADNVYKCPSDRFLSGVQRRNGWRERVRSVAMNGTLGHVNYASNSGPFDTGTYKIALSLGDLISPGPAATSLFLDEHPDSVNDPFFFPPQANLVDVPAALHNGLGTISFTDGHVEFHPWRNGRGLSRVTLISLQVKSDPVDVTWLSYHSNRVGEKTY